MQPSDKLRHGEQPRHAVAGKGVLTCLRNDPDRREVAKDAACTSVWLSCDDVSDSPVKIRAAPVFSAISSTVSGPGFVQQREQTHVAADLHDGRSQVLPVSSRRLISLIRQLYLIDDPHHGVLRELDGPR
jgi:hypothetical protein